MHVSQIVNSDIARFASVYERQGRPPFLRSNSPLSSVMTSCVSLAPDARRITTTDCLWGIASIACSSVLLIP